MAPRNNERADEIRKLKAQGLTQKEIGKMFGVTQGAIKNMSRTHGIIWERRNGDQRGEKNHQYKNGQAKSTIERLTRRVVEASGRSLYKCERCGNVNKNQEQHRHHKDRNRANNDSTNLEVLCATCHIKEHNLTRVRDLGGKYK